MRGVERDRRHLLAASTLCLYVDAVTLTCCACGLDGVETLVFLLFAGLTAFWRIAEILSSVEGLLAGGPYKWFPAVDALDGEVLERRF